MSEEEITQKLNKEILLNINIVEDDIIWKMYQKTYRNSQFIIILMFVNLFALFLVQNIFKNVKTDFGVSLGSILGFVISIYSIILLIIEMFIIKNSRKAWNKAREEHNKLFRKEEKQEVDIYGTSHKRWC